MFCSYKNSCLVVIFCSYKYKYNSRSSGQLLQSAAEGNLLNDILGFPDCKLVFDSISSNIDEVLSINPSANVFVFGDFNVNHKDWLIYSVGTDRPSELC